MPELSPEELAYLQQRKGAVNRLLMWVKAANRETGLPEYIGFWNGDDHQQFVIDGQTRTYYGAGTALGYSDIVCEPGEIVQKQRVVLSGIHPVVAKAFREFDARLASAVIHSAVYHMHDRTLVTAPRRVFSGEIDTAPIQDDAVSGENDEVRSELIATLISTSRSMTKTHPWFKSHAAQEERSPGDIFRKNSATVSDRIAFWGSKEVRAAEVSTPAPKPDNTSVKWMTSK